jgi:hypothetical protein
LITITFVAERSTSIAQHLNREINGRVEKGAIDGSSAVSNVQDLHVNPGA